MEIVLQWLDDLDDLVYAGALTSERTRLGLLSVGLLASLAYSSAAAASAATPAWLAPVLLGLAFASVGVWSVGAAAFAGKIFQREPA